MTTLTLNINKWLCGGLQPSNKDLLYGDVGPTYMGNEGSELMARNKDQHNMCCLGQFMSQMGVKEDYLKDRLYPSHLDKEEVEEINNETIKNFVYYELMKGNNQHQYISVDTALTHELTEINDNNRTTIFEKIEKMREKLAEHDIKLEVVDPMNELKLVSEFIEKEGL